MNRSTYEQKHGFTLIELLVVISILGLISSVALANLQDAKDKAKVAAGQQFHATLARGGGGGETVGTWEFDEGSGTVATDSSGNGRDGEIVGAIFTSADAGISGPALSFDGGSYIAGGDNFPNPGENGQMTIATWLKPSNIAAHNTLFSAVGADCTAIQVGFVGGIAHAQNAISAGEFGFGPVGEEGGEGGGGVVVPDQPLTEDRVVVNGRWQHIAYVFGNGKITTYVDGQQRGSVSGMGTANCPNGSWTIGADATFGQGYEGLMDSFHIYGSDLTASEIQKIYAQERIVREILVSR